MFPAEALAAELTSRGHRVTLMTDARTQPGAVFTERHVLSGAGIAGRGLARGVKAIGAMGKGTVQARRLLSAHPARRAGGVSAAIPAWPRSPPAG